MVKKIIIYGCSNSGYRPLPIWTECMEKCKAKIGIEYIHEVFEAPAEHQSNPGFQQRSWYWYTANKLAMCSNALNKHAGGYDIFMFSDCDVIFFENSRGWESMTEWFFAQPLSVCYMKDHGTDVFNSGVYMIKSSAFRQMAHLNLLFHRLATEKNLYYGDQTAINYMRPVFRAGHIHQKFTFGGERQSGSELVFYHGVGGGDHMTPVQHGATPNAPFYEKKIKHLLEMRELGTARLGL